MTPECLGARDVITFSPGIDDGIKLVGFALGSAMRQAWRQMLMHC